MVLHKYYDLNTEASESPNLENAGLTKELNMYEHFLYPNWPMPSRLKDNTVVFFGLCQSIQALFAFNNDFSVRI